MLRAATLYAFCCIALTAASTLDEPSVVTWTVADEALIIRWRYESNPSCGFFVSVEEATISEQDGLLDFQTPTYLQAEQSARSIHIHGLVPSATYRIAVISCSGKQEMKASDAVILDTLELKFLKVRFLTVANITSSTAILQWNHAYKHSVNHVQFKLECYGVRSYPKRGQNGADDLHFKDVIAPSTTGVVTYTANNLASNCRYACRLNSIGGGSESGSYEEITFTTADGTPSPPSRPTIVAGTLKGAPFVLKLYPTIGIVSRYKLYLLALGSLNTQAAAEISDIELAVMEQSVSKIRALAPVTVATYGAPFLPPELPVDRRLSKILKQNMYYTFILEACADNQEIEKEACSLSLPATLMFIDQATVREWMEEQRAIIREVALMVSLPAGIVGVVVVVALAVFLKQMVKCQKVQYLSNSDSDSSSGGEQQMEHFQQRYRGHPWMSKKDSAQYKSKQKKAMPRWTPISKHKPGPSHPPPQSHPPPLSNPSPQSHPPPLSNPSPQSHPPPLSHPTLLLHPPLVGSSSPDFRSKACCNKEQMQEERPCLINHSQRDPSSGSSITTESLSPEKATPPLPHAASITAVTAPVASTSVTHERSDPVITAVTAPMASTSVTHERSDPVIAAVTAPMASTSVTHERSDPVITAVTAPMASTSVRSDPIIQGTLSTVSSSADFSMLCATRSYAMPSDLGPQTSLCSRTSLLLATPSTTTSPSLAPPPHSRSLAMATPSTTSPSLAPPPHSRSLAMATPTITTSPSLAPPPHCRSLAVATPTITTSPSLAPPPHCRSLAVATPTITTSPSLAPPPHCRSLAVATPTITTSPSLAPPPHSRSLAVATPTITTSPSLAPPPHSRSLAVATPTITTSPSLAPPPHSRSLAVATPTITTSPSLAPPRSRSLAVATPSTTSVSDAKKSTSAYSYKYIPSLVLKLEPLPNPQTLKKNMVRGSAPNSYGSRRRGEHVSHSRAEEYNHLYWAMPPTIPTCLYLKQFRKENERMEAELKLKSSVGRSGRRKALPLPPPPLSTTQSSSEQLL